MATIKPFRALRPDPFYAERLVFPENKNIHFFGLDADKASLKSLKERLEAPARKRPETESGQESAYQEIRKNLVTLKHMMRIRRDKKPGIFICEIEHAGYVQRGVWALTSIYDYINGDVKIHEQTLADSERRISNYRKFTGLEGSPVLLTYPPDETINRIISEICAAGRSSIITNGKNKHRLWTVENPEQIEALIIAFANVHTSFLADGHHRMAGTAKLALDTKEEHFISSLYIAADQLRIIDYHRVVVPDMIVTEEWLLHRLNSICEVKARTFNKAVRPGRHGLIGMCFQGQWYELHVIDQNALDVVTLQDQVLKPLFGIDDPRTNPRLRCIGGEHAMDEIAMIIKDEPLAVAFTLCPMTVEQLMTAAGNNQILPPKSTWIDPKVPYGLLMYRDEDYHKRL
jgi:uncharacterized protein (DUF1015 family)